MKHQIKQAFGKSRKSEKEGNQEKQEIVNGRKSEIVANPKKGNKKIVKLDKQEIKQKI